jgi:hypothetical protein
MVFRWAFSDNYLYQQNYYRIMNETNNPPPRKDIIIGMILIVLLNLYLTLSGFGQAIPHKFRYNYLFYIAGALASINLVLSAIQLFKKQKNLNTVLTVIFIVLITSALTEKGLFQNIILFAGLLYLGYIVKLKRSLGN